MRSIWMTITTVFVMTCVVCCARQTTAPPPQPISPPPHAGPFEISDVSVHPTIFNPAQGESVTIGCKLARPGRAIASIFSMDQRLIRELLPVSTFKAWADTLEFRWDGRDLEGHLVPDGAFGFTIKALSYGGEKAAYDIFEIGSTQYLPLEVKHDPRTQQISYTLPSPSLVSLRAGVRRGPLMKNLIGWRPRTAGDHSEAWNGKDGAGRIDVFAIEGAYLLGEAIAFSDKVILSEGNNDYSYATYAKTIANDRPLKEIKSDMAIRGPKKEIIYHAIPTGGDRMDVRLKIAGGITTDDALVISGRTPIKIFLSEHTKQQFAGERYEILCYVDYHFITEFEEGFSPTTWELDASRFSEGAHVVTVHVATLSGQMGSASIPIVIKHQISSDLEK